MEAFVQTQLADMQSLLAENNDRVMRLLTQRLKTLHVNISSQPAVFLPHAAPTTAAPLLNIEEEDTFVERHASVDHEIGENSQFRVPPGTVDKAKHRRAAWGGAETEEVFVVPPAKNGSFDFRVAPENSGSVEGSSSSVAGPAGKRPSMRRSIAFADFNRHSCEDTVVLGLKHADTSIGEKLFHRSQSNVDGLVEAPRAVFADVAAMKDRVRAAIAQKPYNVQEFYKETGVPQMLARSSLFESITLAIIGVNSIWIAVDTDHNDHDTLLDAELHFQIAENCFCAYFVFEWLIRFLAFRRTTDSLRDAWFLFDSALVILMIFETWLLTMFFVIIGSRTNSMGTGFLRIAKLMRLTRVARMARLLRAFPELLVLIKGIVVATRSVAFTLCLLFIIVYIFALAFVQLDEALHEDSSQRSFKTVPDTFAYLLLRGTLADHADLFYSTGKHHIILVSLLSIFILIATLTVMNMLTGVLVEVVKVVSTVEKESIVVGYVRSQLITVMAANGVEFGQDHTISQEQFKSLLLNPSAARVLSDVGVDVVGLVDVNEFIFKDKSEIGVGDFMELILQLRGNNTATVRDIVDLRKLIVTELTNTEKRIMLRMNGEKDNRRGHPRKVSSEAEFDYDFGRAEKLIAAAVSGLGECIAEHPVTGFVSNPGFLV